MPPGRSFLDLPGEIRNLIYGFCIPSNCTADLDTNADCISLSLSLVNRQTYRETRSFIYEQVKFNFKSSLDDEILNRDDTLSPEEQVLPDEELITFLNQIGPRNSRWITEIGIPFPSTKRRDETVRLDSVTGRALRMLQDYCPNLKKLNLGCTSVISQNGMLAYHFLCSEGVHAKVLDLVFSRLRAFPSELEVVFNIFTHCDCLYRDEFTAKIAAYGWTVNVLRDENAIEEEMFLPLYLTGSSGSDSEDSEYDDIDFDL
ncbi:hypothetical protein PMG11_06459 [Penicillium brasilianum]|uniref:Uncharacterized protein n=1 Tax=Penicillium brasilianum TaxID=104259 RepID=A0A0F7TLW7_PENBI|nr:hypothetical protein PMG11_06459 [Penicillium brasilianum]